MQVFKAYFKIIRKNLPSMSIYLGIFLFFVYLLTFYMTPGPTGDFMANRVRLAVLQEDGDNPISRDLADFLIGQSQLISLDNDSESLQDALFFRQVDYILRIPAGFGESISKGRYNVELVKTSLPDSVSAVQADLLIDRYINTVALYVDSVPNLAIPELLAHVRADLALQANVTLQSTALVQDFSRSRFYFSYLAYTLMSVMVLGITSIMIAFNNKDLQKRNYSSPVRLVSFNLQLVLGNFVFALAVWALLTALSLLIGDQAYSTATRILLSINALAFTLACLGISFLIGNLIKSRNVQQSIANVLALGTCFISGVFVPQELLGPTVKTIASFTPTFWYISNVMDLNGPVEAAAYATKIVIQLGFAVAAVIVAMVVAKQKRMADNA